MGEHLGGGAQGGEEHLDGSVVLPVITPGPREISGAYLIHIQ